MSTNQPLNHPFMVRRAAVLGAGVMGAGIAAQVANAGVPVLLLDIVPKIGENRNAIAEGAIAKWRETMGATNPANAAEGTIRKRFATGIEFNVIHGSDAPETAAFELGYFFRGMELR